MALFLLRFALWGAAALAAWPPEPQPVGTSSVTTVTWGQFQPQDWVTATPFTATVTVTDTQGVVTATAGFRTSANGGGTWTPWSPDQPDDHGER